MSTTHSLASRPKFHPRLFIAIPIVIVLVAGYVTYALTRPFGTIKASDLNYQAPTVATSSVSWPAYGESAIGVVGQGVLATSAKQDAVPIASTTKSMLAVMVLKQKPLAAGEKGPLLTMSQSDVDLFNEYVAKNASVVPVQAGEELTQYQMLQALLLGSGGNIAHALAVWAYGSVDAYLLAANEYAKSIGMSSTHIADASGIAKETVSNAHDLTLLGQEVMSSPVLAEIVGQSEASLPVAGRVANYNVIIGQENVVGIKTGTTDEAGGCFMFATKQIIDGEEKVIVGAILGATSRAVVLNDTVKFIKNNKANVKAATAIKKGDVVATYTTPWGAKVNAVAQSESKLYVTDRQILAGSYQLQDITGPVESGYEVGKLKITAGASTRDVPLVLDSAIAPAPIWWRLTHPR